MAAVTVLPVCEIPCLFDPLDPRCQPERGDEEDLVEALVDFVPEAPEERPFYFIGDSQWHTRPGIYLCIDGSGGQATEVRLRRVGWGVVVMDAEDVFVAGWFGALAGAKQTVPRAELQACWSTSGGPQSPVATFHGPPKHRH